MKKIYSPPVAAIALVVLGDVATAQEIEFERVSNAKGLISGLDYYPMWNAGLVPAVKASSVLEVLEQGNVIAMFPLTGSSMAIDQLQQRCN